MLWTDKLEVATIERQQKLDVQAFRCRSDHCAEDLCGAKVVFFKRSLQSCFGRCKTRDEIRSGFVSNIASQKICNFGDRWNRVEQSVRECFPERGLLPHVPLRMH